MILKIAIADTNEEYVKRILSVLEEYEDLNLSVFTDENTLEQALMSQKFDVLLFDASVYDGHADGGKRFLPILLLDEITANLDVGTEQEVLYALRRAGENRTVVSISHRLYEKMGGRELVIG